MIQGEMHILRTNNLDVQYLSFLMTPNDSWAWVGGGEGGGLLLAISECAQAKTRGGGMPSNVE
jgi:hypothetical protein